jgi:hypothetical protein
MPNDRDNAIRGQDVKLEIQYFDVSGDPVEPDEMPQVRIVDSVGGVLLDYTDVDVYRLEPGLYQIEYEVPSAGSIGMWMDEWRATIGGQVLDTVFVFTVVDAETGVVETTGPGRIKIGDAVVFDFSDDELLGLNILLQYLKARLNSDGTKPMRDQFGAFVRDAYGEIITEECNVFDNEILVTFLCQALSEFNMVPFFTGYTFADPVIQTLFAQAIVEGAYIVAIAAQSLIEKGRDFTISDGGLNYQPPQLGDFLQSNYTTWLTSYRERLRFIKNSIRPGPQSFGTYSNMASGAPAFTRLRHLRARRIY